MRVLIASVLLVISAGSASAAKDPVVVFLERNGQVVEADDGDVKIPRFGGGDRVWTGIVGCVAQHFAPFRIEVVDHKPARGEFITAVVGGRASQLGLDDETTNGVGPYDGSVLRSARVYVFSKVSGERDVANLCAVTAHEVAHALGLDHSMTCGDIMSYDLDACGTRRFMNVDAPCGEGEARTCAGGEETQNSYQRLGRLVGFRSDPEPEPAPAEIDAPAEVDDVDAIEEADQVDAFDPFDGVDDIDDIDDVDAIDEADHDARNEVDDTAAAVVEPAPAPHRGCRDRAHHGHRRWRRR